MFSFNRGPLNNRTREISRLIKNPFDPNPELLSNLWLKVKTTGLYTLERHLLRFTENLVIIIPSSDLRTKKLSLKKRKRSSQLTNEQIFVMVDKSNKDRTIDVL